MIDHRADIRSEPALDDIMAGFQPEAFIHFAGFQAVGESTVKPLAYFDVNIAGTLTLNCKRGLCI